MILIYSKTPEELQKKKNKKQNQEEVASAFFLLKDSYSSFPGFQIHKYLCLWKCLKSWCHWYGLTCPPLHCSAQRKMDVSVNGCRYGFNYFCMQLCTDNSQHSPGFCNSQHLPTFCMIMFPKQTSQNPASGIVDTILSLLRS